MADVQVSQAAVFSLVDLDGAASVEVSQSGVFALGAFPAEEVHSTNTGLFVLGEAETVVRISSSLVLALAAGRIQDPSVRVWTFTLDGHDFYVIHLGVDETLIYDLSTELWYKWESSEEGPWSAFQGINWTAGNKFSSEYGSNVLAGSDANGSLYFLDPDSDLDDAAGTETQIPFTRTITSSLPMRGFDRQRVYEVQLVGTTGELTDTSLTGITLSYSDDRGDNYVDVGTITIPSGDYEARATWRSLGSFSQPGRLFQIQDNGALRRIDSLTVNLGMDAANGS